MSPKKTEQHKIILIIVGLLVLAMGVTLLLIPPAVFMDPQQGFQVLQSMQHGGGFNNLVAPDQGDISQNYSQFLTWWSPGQYLVPYFFKVISGLNLGQGIAVTTLLSEITGLAGLYCFFKKIGFASIVAAISILLIFCQVIFMVPQVYYPGGEILLFAFTGWFLYGCVAIERPGIGLFLFVLFSGFVGFFFKSSFLWMYGAGLLCLWLRLSAGQKNVQRVKAAAWIGFAAIIAVGIIYKFYLSQGETPLKTASGLKLTAETFSFPLASPLLAGFSVDDMFNGLVDHIGKQILSPQMSLVVLLMAAVISVILVLAVLRYAPNKTYRLFLLVFYAAAVMFFGLSYLRQSDISMESRHFRIIGLLITPGVIYLVSRSKPVYRVVFGLVFACIAVYSFNYLVKGYQINSTQARGPLGIAQPDIDQASLNQVLRLDQEKRGITFVFIGSGIGLELKNNRYIALPPISDSLKINTDDYEYEGFGGPLYIILPETYNGPKEKMVMKSFPNYAGWNVSMLDDKYVLYIADRKR